MRRAMLAGARDFLTKPPMGDELISAIRRAGAMAQTEKSKSAQIARRSDFRERGINDGLWWHPKAKLLLSIAQRAELVVRRLAVNLALTLNNEDTRVALVDGNLQFGDVAVFINEQGKNTIIDLARVPMNWILKLLKR